MEGQEEAGMSLLGLFRDLDRPDHFVWLRGFRDMDSRHDALTAFYSGPVWKEHGQIRPADDGRHRRRAAAAAGGRRQRSRPGAAAGAGHRARRPGWCW